MPSDTTQKLTDEIAEIVRRVGKREEIEEQIAENVSFSEVVTDLLKIDGPVRDAVTRAVVSFLKGYEIEGDSDAASEIIEAIDFEKFVPTLLEGEDFQKTIADAIENLIENGDLDLSSAVDDCVGEEDIKKALDTPAMKEILAEKIKSYLEGCDLSDIDSFSDKFDEIAFTPERIEAALESNTKELDEKIMEQVQSYLENMDESSDSPIAAAVTESKAFKNALDKALEDLIESGKIGRLVEKVATDMLSGDDSEFRTQLTQAISTQMVGKIAGSIVDKLFIR